MNLLIGVLDYGTGVCGQSYFTVSLLHPLFFTVFLTPFLTPFYCLMNFLTLTVLSPVPFPAGR
jgi:hypothetical protein